MFVDFCNAAAKVRSYEELPALNFSLDDDEAEVGFGVHIACHFFHFGDLRLDESGDAV